MVTQKGKGGIKHQMLQETIAEYFRKQGKFAQIEANIGKNIDVLVIDNDKTIGIEVQLSTKHCLQVTEDFKLGCDEVWIVCENEKLLRNIMNILQKNLASELFARTKFRVADDFITKEV